MLQGFSEDNKPTYKSEAAQHTKSHIEQLFDWSIFCNSPFNNQIRKNLKASLLVS